MNSPAESQILKESQVSKYIKGGYCLGYTFLEEIMEEYWDKQHASLRENFEFQHERTTSDIRRRGLEYLLSSDYPEKETIMPTLLVSLVGGLSGVAASIIFGPIDLIYNRISEYKKK